MLSCLEIFGQSHNSTSSKIEDIIDPPRFDSLYQNYPNPIGSHCKIEFKIREDSHLLFELYSIKGTLIQILIKQDLEAGHYVLELDSKWTRSLVSGIYIYRIIANGKLTGREFIKSAKMVLLK